MDKLFTAAVVIATVLAFFLVIVPTMSQVLDPITHALEMPA